MSIARSALQNILGTSLRNIDSGPPSLYRSNACHVMMLRKGQGLFRTTTELDLAIAIDHDPGVEYWMHLPLAVRGRLEDDRAVVHAPDFMIRRPDDSRVYVDAEGIDGLRLEGPSADYVDASATGILNPVVVANRTSIRKCASFLVPLREQARLASILAERGTMPLAEAARSIGDTAWGIEIVLALASRGIVSVDICEDAIGPATIVRLPDPSTSAFARENVRRSLRNRSATTGCSIASTDFHAAGSRIESARAIA